MIVQTSTSWKFVEVDGLWLDLDFLKKFNNVFSLKLFVIECKIWEFKWTLFKWSWMHSYVENNLAIPFTYFL